LHAVVSDLYFDRLAARASVNSICLSRSTWCVKSNYLGIFRYLFKHSNCEIWSFICIALQHFNLWAVARAGFDLAKRKKPASYAKLRSKSDRDFSHVFAGPNF